MHKINLVKNYKQYFTPEKLAAYMIGIIPDDKIETVVDLSMGECGLLEEARLRWSNAELYGADIDKKLITKINIRSPYINTFYGNSLSVRFKKWESYNKIIEKCGFDLAIANPPFNFYNQKMVNIDENEKIALPIEIRFLLKYIEIVKEGGYICIILPYGFLSLDLYRNLRMQLLNKVTIIKIIKIFDGCFEKIDADTCLILMQKKKKDGKNIQTEIFIGYLDSDYCLSWEQTALISKTDRWDLEYQSLLDKANIIVNSTSLKKDVMSNYIKSCKRGKSITKNKEFLRSNGIRFIHTTDVKKLFISDEKSHYVYKDQFFESVILHERDILVGRVGKGCIGKIGIVSKQYKNQYFSDCLFAIKTKNINPYYLTLFLASKFGQMQLKGIAKGSCSKYITKEGLFNICVLVPDKKVQDYFGNKYKKLLLKSRDINEEGVFIDLLEELDKIIEKNDRKEE